MSFYTELMDYYSSLSDEELINHYIKKVKEQNNLKNSIFIELIKKEIEKRKIDLTLINIFM